MDRAAARIIDANANRAREALRVMEDIARFALGDGDLSGEIKGLRHGLAGALEGLPGSGGFIVWRDTPGDVGTGISTEREGVRAGLEAVAGAAGKRLTEALRSIEECAKVVGSGESFEGLRYRSYRVEQRLMLALGSARGEMVCVCVLVTEALCAHASWEEVARESMAAGATMVQLREKELSDRELVKRARRLVEMGRGAGVRVIVNDRPEIALLADADGVHLGQDDLSVEEARRIVGMGKVIGVSTARIEDAERALEDGAGYCGVGPMFATTTKYKPEISGPAYLREYLAHEPALPSAIAIGGINAGNVGELLEAGARAVAVSSAVCGARDPGAACGELVKMMEKGLRPEG